jgi:alpha-tubulin suppressor-like RCC1 family protein
MSYIAFAQCYSSSRSSSETTIARQTDGTLWAKGNNTDSTMGNGNTTPSGAFEQIGTDSNWTDNYSIGSSHALAIKTNGTLWAWGMNNNQLGIGTLGTANIVLPTQVGTDDNWSQVVAGSDFSLGIKSDGTLYSWGSNNYGSLGTGVLPVNTTDYQLIPAQVGTANNWLKVFTDGGSYCYAIKTNGTLWSWGGGNQNNGFYLLGYAASGNDYLTPHQVGTSTNWVTVAITYNFVAAIRTDGTLWVWGNNNKGLFGNGTPIGVLTTSLFPIQLGTDTNWKDVNLNYNRNCLALKINGTRWGWGYNNNFDLGNGTNTPILVPTQLDNDTDWLSIGFDNVSPGGYSIKQNHSLYGWSYSYTSLSTYVLYQVPMLLGTSCTLGNESFDSQTELTAYPNPFSNNFTINIQSPSSDDINIKVYDMIGKLVDEQTIESINASDYQLGKGYATGVYNVIINQGENRKVLRVVKR